MKTFTKKSLSVIMAALMALTSLTVGSISAFAATDTEYTAVGETTSTFTVNDKGESVKVKFTPSTNDYYNIKTIAVKDGVNSYSKFTLEKNVAEEGSSTLKLSPVYNAYDENYNDGYEAYSTTFKAVNAAATANDYGRVENPFTETDVTTYAQTSLKLTAGETYYLTLSASAGATVYLSIGKTDYIYSYTDVTTDDVEYISDYNYNSATDKYDDPVRTTADLVSAIGVNVTKYVGKSTTVAVPAQIDGYAVQSVNLNVNNPLRKRITTVSIPEGVKEVGSMSNMYALSSLTLPSTLETIDSGAFANDTALAGTLVLGANVKTVGDIAFYNTNYTVVEITSAKTEIGTQAFGYKEVLNTATADPTDTTDEAIAGFKMIAPTNSPAAIYASENGFRLLDRAVCAAGTHYYVTTAATLFKKGSKVCELCGNKVSIKKKKIAISSLKKGKKSLTVKTKKYSKVKKYEIQVSTSKKFTKKTTKTVTVKSSKALNKKVTGLKSGKKYYVRVRAYNGTGKKAAKSSWSSAKSVKVK